MPQDKPLEIKALIADKQFLSGNSRLSESIEDYPEGIIIPIDKPYRWTSADVIRKVKWAACRHFHKKNLKVGHAGNRQKPVLDRIGHDLGQVLRRPRGRGHR